MARRARPFRVTWWDRFLAGIAPDWARRRLQARATLAAFDARSYQYEAAAGGRRADGWHHASSDANTAINTSLTSLRELSRDLRRNNGWARRGVQAIVNNTIGWGIQARPVAAAAEVRRLARDAWKAWSESIACDYDGRLPFTGLQRLVMDAVVESGEALILRRTATPADGLPVPLRVRVVEPDYLDSSRDGTVGHAGGLIVQGIEFDRQGRRVAYWLFRDHPGGTPLSGASLASDRVPAADVIHVYQIERPGQSRGVPWLTSAIARLHDFDDYDDAVLIQQKIAACFGAFVTDINALPSPIGSQSGTDETDRLETLEPGHIAYLTPGRDVKFSTPPTVADQSFSVRNLRRIAASLGVTYEDLSDDYSQVNFSSARMARLAHYANVDDWRWNMIIPQLCDGVWRWFAESAAGLQAWPEVPRALWSPPPIPMLEPDKEGLAYSRLIRNGVRTYDQVQLELGQDPEAQLDEIEEFNRRLDDRKIVLDCDPRRTTASGGAMSSGGGQGIGGAVAEDIPPAEEDADAESAAEDDADAAGESASEPS